MELKDLSPEKQVEFNQTMKEARKQMLKVIGLYLAMLVILTVVNLVINVAFFQGSKSIHFFIQALTTFLVILAMNKELSDLSDTFRAKVLEIIDKN